MKDYLLVEMGEYEASLLGPEAGEVKCELPLDCTYFFNEEEERHFLKVANIAERGNLTDI